MRVYLDTSLIISLLLRERAHVAWLDWLAEVRPEPCFSTFGAGEMAAAIAAKVRRGELDTVSGAQVRASISDYLATITVIPTLDEDVRLASSFAARFDVALKLPDAIHLAIAHRLAIPIASRDRQQLHAASTLMLPVITFED